MVNGNGTIAKHSEWVQVDGQQLLTLAQAGLAWLEAHVEEVNELNVFPVPDGDTGTNMLWTMRAACARVAKAQPDTAGGTAAQLARGALMGARGNSGVILSQFWQGFARGLQGERVLHPAGLARAFHYARKAAYAAVPQPVEGTILTVIRAGALAAAAVADVTDVRAALEAVVRESAAALAHTPEMLPVLKQAGVVDSGGQGLFFILEGMLRHMQGLTAAEVQPPATATMAVAAKGAPATEQLAYPYDVQFLLEADGVDVTTVRARIEAMGDCALVVSDGQTIKVHVHVADPGLPLGYGASLGRLEDVVVENMQAQVDERRDPALPETKVGVVAVAAGAGFVTLFREMGAVVVDGGQTNNPGVETLLEAIDNVHAETVILLPNNKNIILAAEAAAAFATKPVEVIPTRTVPQGVSAMLGFRADGELAQVTAQMAAAGQRVASGAITTATRTVTLDDVPVRAGQAIALADDRLCAAADDVGELLPSLLQALKLDRRELLSVYYGNGTTATDAGRFATHIEHLYPQVEVEVIAGGTPHYHYLFGAE